jgi:two-component system response regulator QseB
VQALEVGVDDYVMRPVHVDEFAARAKALVRRAGATQFERVRVGNLELTEAGDLFLAEKRVDLHQAEQKVLSILARRSGRVVSKAMLERAVAGTDREELSSNAIEQRMSRLRRILDASDSSVRITTVRGSGYMLEAATRKEAQPGVSGDHAIASYIEV